MNPPPDTVCICRCRRHPNGCPADAHDHYRSGSDCGCCGSALCPRFQKAPTTRRIGEVRVGAGFAGSLPARVAPPVELVDDLRRFGFAVEVTAWDDHGPDQSTQPAYRFRVDPRCVILTAAPARLARVDIHHHDACTCSAIPAAEGTPA